MALAPVIPRLHSLCLPIATTGITMDRVPDVTFDRASLVAVVGLALVRCQTVAATVHCGDTPDDKDNGEETEDQDIEHGPLDHGRPEMSCPHCFVAAPPTRRPGAGADITPRVHWSRGSIVYLEEGDRVRVRATVGATALAMIMCACSSPPHPAATSSTASQGSSVASQVQDILSASESSLDQVPGHSAPCSPDCTLYVWPVADIIPIVNRVADQLQAFRYPAADRRDAAALVASLRNFTTNRRAGTNSLVDDATYQADLTRFVRQLRLPADDAGFDPAVTKVESGQIQPSGVPTSNGK